jgi:hypothetical protein
MRRLLSLVVVVLLLTVASPVFACVTQLTMTPTEKACCARMHGHCEEMMGPCCCVVHQRGDLSQVPAARSDAPQVVFQAAEVPAAFYAELWSAREMPLARVSERPPPLLMHLSTIVLRI